MMPNPPTWMSPRITTCPKGVQKVGVSTVISPVTQTAETAVNRAGMNVSASGSVCETGSISSPAPSTMTLRKANGTLRTGCNRAATTPCA